MKLLFLGDFYYGYNYIMPDIEEIGKYIKTNNYYVILNLESPLNASGKPINKGGPNLHSDEKAIEALRQLNVIAVCLANNHMMDFGSEALEKTIDILDKAGIPHVGAGMNLGEALRPVIIECEGQKIVLQNFAWKYEEAVYATKTTAGVAPRDDVTVKRSTIENKNKYQDSILVTVMHWGFENNTLPMPYDIQLAHECIDNGSDLVIGSHPHVTQPFEKYKGKYIFYSLGNFYFAERRKRYKRQFSNEVFTNMNDYGMGVVYDIKNRNTLIDESVVLEYRHDLDRTIISNCHEILRDISDIDWNSKQYKEEVINHKNNINPVLGTNANVNTLCLFGLSIVHGLSKRSQFIKKSKLGGVIFSK